MILVVIIISSILLRQRLMLLLLYRQPAASICLLTSITRTLGTNALSNEALFSQAQYCCTPAAACDLHPPHPAWTGV